MYYFKLYEVYLSSFFFGSSIYYLNISDSIIDNAYLSIALPKISTEVGILLLVYILILV